jgi:hypothetical protein
MRWDADGSNRLPFSVHLVYAIVQVHSRARGRRGEFGSGTELAHLSAGVGGGHWAGQEDDEQEDRSLGDEFRWPLKSNLWPNWILQLVFLPVLSMARALGSESYSRWSSL